MTPSITTHHYNTCFVPRHSALILEQNLSANNTLEKITQFLLAKKVYIFRRLPETNQFISKTTEDRAKPSEDHPNTSKDYRRPHETFGRFPKISRILPKFSEDAEKRVTISGDL